MPSATVRLGYAKLCQRATIHTVFGCEDSVLAYQCGYIRYQGSHRRSHVGHFRPVRLSSHRPRRGCERF